MKLRTRPRTGPRSPRSSRGAEVPEGLVRCDLCQRTVPAGPEGRCVLGHRLPVPAHAGSPQAAPSAAAAADATQAPQPPLPSEAPVAQGSLVAPDEAGAAVATASASSTRDYAQDYLAQLGDLAGWEPSAPPAAPAASPDARHEEAAVADTEDPLAWLERFAAPAAAAAPSAPLAEEPAGTASQQGDGGGADIPAQADAAVDVAAAEDGAEDGDEDGDDRASEDAWSELRAEEEAAQDARMARRQRVAVITGGAIFGLLTFGAVALTLVP